MMTSMRGSMFMSTTCSACGGQGVKVKTRCTDCNGKGYTSTEE